MGTEIIKVVLVAVLGIFSVPFIENIDPSPTFSSPEPTATAASTESPDPTNTPISNATTTTLPEDGVFEQTDGSSSVRIEKSNGTTSVKVTVEGNGSADVNVDSNVNSSSTSTYKSETHIESSVNSD